MKIVISGGRINLWWGINFGKGESTGQIFPGGGISKFSASRETFLHLPQKGKPCIKYASFG